MMNTNSQLLIKGGQVVDVQNNTCQVRDILICDNVISPLDKKSADCEVFDVTNMIITPGLVDMHVHFREPGGEHKETIETGSKAAARGGFTTVCCMPNTSPTIDCGEIVEFVSNCGKSVGLVNLLVAGAITKGLSGAELANYEEMLKAGICALSDDGKTVTDYDLMLEVAKQAVNLGLLITDHTENHAKSTDGVINEGKVAEKLGVRGIPNCCEADMVERDINIAKATGCRFHLQHISTAESIELIREAKREGLPITAEAAPHHFSLTDDAVLKHGANAKMNPPLRSEKDRQAVISALCDDTIDAIATDHAPHSKQEKKEPLAIAPFGIVGLETSFAISYTNLVLTGHLKLPELLRLMSLNPAKILGLKTNNLDVGSVANLAVFDIREPYIIKSEDFASKARNTPFEGVEVYGSTALTICNGKITYGRRNNDR